MLGMADADQVLIVGASLAGIRAANALRRAKFAGRITLAGGETHLPYDRPPLSKQFLMGDWDRERIALTNAAEIEKLGIELRLGHRAVSLDTATRTVTFEDGELSYDQLVIATGATPRVLPGTPMLSGIHTLRTVEDSLAIREGFARGGGLVVVGGGFIGAEVAAAARKQGLEVTILEALAQPMERALGPNIGAICARIHRDRGVDVRCGVAVAAIEGDGHVESVRLSDGSVVPASLVVVGVGVSPETRWLQSSGLDLRDGVVCDEYLQASAPGVWAAGDVCRWPNPLFGEEMRVEHWTNAVEQGSAVARNIVAGPGNGKPYAPVPYVWSDQYDVSIQYVGRGRGDDELVVKHGSLESGEFVALYGRAGRLMGAVGFNMPRYLNDYRRFVANRASLAEAMAHAPEED